MAPKYEYTLLILRGGIPVTLWKDGTIDIHVPRLLDLETPLGLSWKPSHSFQGKIFGSELPIEITNPKVGNTIIIKDITHNTRSLPVQIDAVYHNDNITQSTTPQTLHAEYPNHIAQFTNFTSWGEYGGYTIILKKYIYELAKSGKDATSVELNTLIEAVKDFAMVYVNPMGFIKDLVKAQILYIDNNQVKYNPVFVYLIMYQINCSFKIGGEPFPFSN